MENAQKRAGCVLGVHVNITEMDFDVLPRGAMARDADVSSHVVAQANLNPYTAGLPDSVQEALSRRYAEIFRVLLKHRDVIDRVTFWGTSDGDSWLNGWPIRGRTSYPLLFDRRGQPKPAFHVVVAVAREVERNDHR